MNTCTRLGDAAANGTRQARHGAAARKDLVELLICLMTFDTNGNERDARRLHSITLISLFLAKYWMLNGPEMFNSFAI